MGKRDFVKRPGYPSLQDVHSMKTIYSIKIDPKIEVFKAGQEIYTVINEDMTTENVDVKELTRRGFFEPQWTDGMYFIDLLLNRVGAKNNKEKLDLLESDQDFVTVLAKDTMTSIPKIWEDCSLDWKDSKVKKEKGFAN